MRGFPVGQATASVPAVEDPDDHVVGAVIAVVAALARAADSLALDLGELIGIDCEHLANDPDCQLAREALAVQHGDQPSHPDCARQAGGGPGPSDYEVSSGRLDVVSVDASDGISDEWLGNPALA